MIGFARATSDGVLSATVWDVAVNPAWQRSGLGRALMERLTKKLVGRAGPGGPGAWDYGARRAEEGDPGSARYCS